MATEAVLHAKEWSQNDPNPVTAAHVKSLISAAENNGSSTSSALQELQCLFPPNNKRIGFGTAGLRSSMSPGPLGMNDLVVIQTAQGLASYLIQISKDGTPITAVVGYDHRANSEFSLSSKQFAMYTKLVFESKGISCTLLDGYVATPILAFAVGNIGASVGIMVTASHNPKQDDGYKVYWGDGCQIRPPIDAEIASAILETKNLKPWMDYGEQLRTFERAASGGGVGECYGLSNPEQTRMIEDAYNQAIRDSGLVVELDVVSDFKPPSFAYTAMHGVGLPYAKRSFETFGLPAFLPVPSQQHPDANFTTVPFPNPEEKGALDEAMSFAEQNNCDIVLANDPDADRLGVAEFNKVDGKWTVFTGDQIGSLLGHWLWETIGKKSEQPVAMCASTVSSKILSAMGQTEGFLFEETLTGFKWIGSRALSLQNEGYRVLLGYEEAIGFSCGGIIPDKDGISALGVIATMAAAFYAEGKTLATHLQEIYFLLYGEFCSNNGYFRCDDPAIVKKIMEQMRNGGKYFDRVGTYEVDSVRDLGSPGYDSQAVDKKPTLPTSSSSPMITFRFKNGCVAQFRASGTEPKFKYYIELRGQPGETRDEVSKRLDTMVKVMLEELLHPSENGLITPSSL